MSVQPRVIERHVSPDGALIFIVTVDDQGDLTLGFDGFAWHVHAALVAEQGQSAGDAATALVRDVLDDKWLIAMGRSASGRDVWLEDEPQNVLDAGGEPTVFRFWSGTRTFVGHAVLDSAVSWKSWHWSART